tara:strand:+ start:2607 stop:3308 length:702 start_codon:yes stop_codon:yes gene_type:complete
MKKYSYIFKKTHRKSKPYSRRSYSQCGEDLIVNFIFSSLLKIDSPSYFDIGAFHPFKMSNTYLFYARGSKGICVESSPIQFEIIRKERPNDLCLNIGISGNETTKMKFFDFDYPELSTFSEEIANQNKIFSKMKKTIEIDTISINKLIEKYNNSYVPDFLSLDVEGLEYEILSNLNFKKYRPKVFCIETINNLTEKKNYELINFVESQGYKLYADTYINSIFVDKKLRENWMS